MRRAGCPDPAAAGLGFATGRGRRARAELAAAILGYRQVVLEAVEETENALGAWAAQERRAQRIDAQLQASRRADAHAGLLYGRGMINLLERLTASVGHRQAELAAVEASEGRALAFVAVNKATGRWRVLARERMGCAHSWASAAGRVSSSGA